jgi:hypothetical protein
MYPWLFRLLAQGALQAHGLTTAPVFGLALYEAAGGRPITGKSLYGGIGEPAPVPEAVVDPLSTQTPPVASPGFALGDYLIARDRATRTPWDLSAYETTTPRRRD